MADDLGIKRCWFHKDHYDIPKQRKVEIEAKCRLISSKQLVTIIKNLGASPSGKASVLHTDTNWFDSSSSYHIKENDDVESST